MHKNAKLTEQQVIDIRNRYANGDKLKAIAKEHCITNQAVHCIVSGLTHKHAGGPITKKNNNISKETVERIRTSRDILGMSLKQIAAETGISTGTVFSITSGRAYKI